MTRRRTVAAVLVLGLAAISGWSCREPRPAPVVIATTTSVDNAGLLEELRVAFREQTGIEIDAFVVGSGKVLRMGRDGMVDVTITHEPRGEAELRATGIVVAHRVFVENRFILVGPRENPARIDSDMTVLEALRQIHERRARFVSRSDESGTHRRELELWRILGIDPDSNPEYRPLGQGMSALLRSANELRAYALTDDATFARFASTLNLAPLATKGEGLRNVYTISLLRGRDGQPAPSAVLFYEWLASDAGVQAVARFAATRGGFRLP
ncbi:MAG TPA: substrate-binding domain-containing protein [Thermoanaerobaculia bacterium]|nr:substrate-binding domain-containing protein [Thermoanaerobaculia bacterium]